MTKLLAHVVLAGLVLGTAFSLPAVHAEDGQDVSLEDMLAKPCPSAAQWLKTREAQVASLRQASAKSKPRDTALHDELLKMEADDVRVRTPLQQAGEHPSQAVVQAVMDVDKRHLERLRAITAHGLPTRDAIGEDGQAALFVLVQHADMDPALQERVLAENAKQGSTGFAPDDAAMLADRVALRLGKAQPYGSQLGYENGHLAPRKPVDDLGEVDKRRAAVHLMPMSDYMCMMGVLQGPH
ncbi:DUF6624 domain-containing protein [Luteibacter sp. ME-Dv--P-043b]|uniref:DUF6624 domain-containing protein n=1 Tax=Luteibacter sp. ME-Dv--P-043b TaxID=3040291 RepID=UPI002552A931|nr:DUF6624 domain-containing protein [Luteibacter sp. ME-Dv--P-043b]